MKSCEHYQAQLLEHLYGLLEAEESLALIEHAGQCDLCRGALLRADSQRQLLSAAAVNEFPAVHFQEPEVVPAVRPMPVKTRAPRRQIHWRRWAVAAAVLVGVTVIGVPVARYAADYRETRDNVESAFASLKTVLAEERKATDEYEAALHKAAVTDETIRRKLDDLGQAQEKKIDELNASKLVLVATGQSVPRIGVPNEYRIETRNLRNDPTEAKLKIIVRDKTSGKAIKEETVDSTGVHIVKLSPDNALKAGSQLVLEVEARSKAGQEVQIKENLTLARPAYVTHLATDKPMYHPGETIRFRSLTLDRYSLRPPAEDFRLIYSLHTQLNGVEQQIALYDESGKEIAQFDQNNNKVSQLVREPRVVLAAVDGAKAADPKSKQAADKPIPSLHGIGAGAFMLPASLPGGEYSLQVRELDSKFPVEKRKFLINNYQPPQLNKELKSFDKSSYGAGAEVVARLKVARAEGGTPLVGQPVIATVRVDGKNYDANGIEIKNPDAAGILGMTDALGEVAVRFKLPATIERGDAMLSVEFTDGATPESLSKPIPVAVRKMNVEFYPEGGYLIAGVPNRVYFRARTLIDKPAEIKGRIEDADGKKVEVFDTDKKALPTVETFNDPTPGVNQGMGEFSFTPQAKGRYRLVIESPEKIEGDYWLPEVQADGVALSVPSGVTNDKQAISVVVTSAGSDRELLIGAYCRGSLLDHKAVKAEASKPTTVDLTPGGSMGGVYRITVFEKQPPNANEPLKPVAERLVYREPSHRLNITITGKKVNAPGDKVTLTLKTSSESGEPLPTVLLVGVVDKSVVTMADERTARTLPTHFLLTSEVRRPEDLEFADVLLTDNLQARKALDLLLGTQGWRRFAESDPDQFRHRQPKKDMEDARVQADLQRVLVSTSLSGEKGTQRVSTIELEKERLLAAFRPKFEELEAEKLVADGTLEETRERGDAASAPMKQMRGRVEAANAAYQGSLEHLKNFDQRNDAIRYWSMVLFGLLLLLAGGISLIVTLVRQVRQAIPVYIGALGMVGLCAAVLVATDLFHFQQPGPTPFASVNDKLLLAPREEPDAEAVGALGDDRPRDQGGQGGGLEKEGRRGGNNADPQARWKRDGNGTPPPAAPGAKFERPEPAVKDVKKQPEPNAATPAKPTAGAGENKEKQADRVRERADKAAEGKKADEMLANKRFAAQAQGPLAPQVPPGFGGMQQNNAQMDALRKANAYRALEEQIQKIAGDGKDADQVNQNRAEALQLREARQAIMLAATPTVVRVYAHQHRANGNKGQNKDTSVRTDFAETLFWHPALVVPGTGEAKIEFDLNDAERSFQVLAAGHSGDGRLGSSITDIESRKPFSLAAAVPLQVVANDTITLPVSVRNSSPEDREVRLNVALQNLKPAGGSDSGLTRVLRLKADERKREVFHFQPTIKEGTARVILTGTTEPFGSDSIAYDITVVPEGFPVNGARSDMLEKGAEHEVKLPKEWVPTTLKAEVSIYPSRLSDLQSGLAALLREPNGCFEQTSSSNYPNILVLDYLEKSKSNDPQTQQRARDLLTRGYAKLVTFECQKGGNQREGYEWFGGQAAPHEALTAYGLMEFYDMQRLGHPVEKAMIERTRQFLMSRRDDKGGFTRNGAAIDTFGRAPENLTNAYIVWALTETDPERTLELKPQLEALIKGAADSKDSYYLALVANCLLNRKMSTEADAVLKKLAAAQKDGCVDGALTSITSSGGRDLQIETTALAVLAWLKTPRPHNYEKNLNDAIKWIGQQRGGYGGFGSTQSTILALKALTSFTAGKASSIEPGEIALVVNGKRVATAAIGPQQKDTLTLVVPNAEEVFKAGEENKVEILSTSKTPLPYTLSWSYMTRTPDNAAQPPIRLVTKLDRTTALDGQAVNLTIEVTNTTDKDQGMVTAIIGLPAGLSLPEDFAQLKDYLRSRDNGKEPARISHFEIRDRDLVIYWRGMKAKDTVKLDLTLNCRVPGEYRGQASRAYLYYNADQKHWVEPIKVSLKAD